MKIINTNNGTAKKAAALIRHLHKAERILYGY